MLTNINKELLDELKKLSEDNLIIDLDKIDQILENYDIIDLINHLPEILPITITNKIEEINSEYETGSDEFKKNDIDLILNILKICEIYLKKTAFNEDLKFIYPVAIIFYHLQVKTECLSIITEYNTFSNIKKLIFEFLCNLKETYELPEDFPHIVKISHENYIKGIKNEDLKLVYEEYIDKNKGNFPENVFISFLVRILLLEPDNYIYFLKSIKKHFILIKYICMIENKVNNEIIEAIIRLEDKWIIIEYLRQIIKYTNKKNFGESEILLVSTMFEKLYSIDEIFFINGIILFLNYENKVLFGKIIGRALANINNEELIGKLLDQRDICIDLIEIYPNFNLGLDYEAKLNKSMLKSMNDHKKRNNQPNNIFWDIILSSLIKFNEPLASFLAEKVFIKWENFLENLWKSMLIPNDFIGTEFNNIIIYYFILLLKKDESSFLKLLNEKLDDIINYKSYWIYYTSNKRFIPLTYVYAMSYSWINVHKHVIHNKILNDKLLFLLNDECMFLSLFNQNHTPNEFLEIEKNFKSMNF